MRYINRHYRTFDIHFYIFFTIGKLSTNINLSHGLCVIAPPILKIKFPVSHNTHTHTPTHTHTHTCHINNICRNDVGMECCL